MVELNGAVLLNGGVGKTIEYKAIVSTPEELSAHRALVIDQYGKKYEVAFITRKPPHIKGHWA